MQLFRRKIQLLRRKLKLMRAHVIVLSSPGSHLRRITDYERIKRVDLMLHVVVFTIFLI